MCIVEVEGMRGYPTSCTTPATEGMVVRTSTPALQDLRRKVLELILLEHPSACLVCGKSDLCEQYRPKAEKAGRTTGCHTCNNKETCEIRELSAELGIADLPVPPFYRDAPIERTDPFMDRDLNLCILCGRCVRICKYQHGTATIDFVGRGSSTRIGEAFGRSLLEAGCRFCGSCVDVCPTGSLADRYAKWHGEPEALTQTTCVYCEAACALELGAEKGRVFTAKAVNSGLPVCVLGRFAIAPFANGTDRLRKPFVRVGTRLRETPWEAALPTAAERLKPFVGNRFAFVCDTTSTLEDRYLFKKFTAEAMRSGHYIEITPDARGISRAELPEETKAALLTGNFVDADQLGKLELLIVQDCYPTPVSERADIVLPAAIFPEVSGTCLDGTGRARPLRKAANPPGEARPEGQIVSDLARALGAEGFPSESAGSVAQEIGIGRAELWIEREEAPPAALNPRVRRTDFRGHSLEEKVRGLRELPVGAAGG